MPKIFISYARDDDEAFARRLYEDLIKAGFDVWWDRESLHSVSLTFHQQIKDAIHKVIDRLIYVAGPRSAISSYVREEWKFALECDKPVLPILRLGNFDLLPAELSLLHCDDFRDDAQYAGQLSRLVANLRRPAPPLGKLHAVPSLPPHYLGRPELLRRVRESILVDLHKPVILSDMMRVGVQGMGGIGKSVLAAALGRDREVRRSYPDGIIWVTFGQRPNLAQLQRDVVKCLGGAETFENEYQGREALRELLVSKSVCLILDDVWEARHAQVFNSLGPRCCALVTTRDAGIVHTLHGVLHQVHLFTEAEALEVLATSLGLPSRELPSEATSIVHECGCLPLAVALCGGMAARGTPWGNILERLRRAELDRIADRNAINEQHRDIYRAMLASVQVIEPELQERFAEIAVFVGERIPLAAIGTLWYHTAGLDNLDTDEVLRNFHERSLIHYDTTGVAMHDLLRDFAARLTDDLTVLHESLIAAYRESCVEGWHTGPNDGYYFQNLVHHLGITRQDRELTRLYSGLDWFEAKWNNGLCADVPREIATVQEVLNDSATESPFCLYLKELRTAFSQEITHFELFDQDRGLTRREYLFQQLRNRLLRNTSGAFELRDRIPFDSENLLLHCRPLRPSVFSRVVSTGPHRTVMLYAGQLATCDNGNLLAFSGNAAVCCIHPDSGKILFKLPTTGRAVSGAIPPGQPIAIVGGDMGSRTATGFIQSFHLGTQQVLSERQLDWLPVTIVAAPPNEVLAIDPHGVVHILRLDNLEETTTWDPFPESEGMALAYCDSRQWIATGERHDKDQPCRIRIWNHRREQIGEVCGPSWAIWTLRFSHDAKTIFAGSQDLRAGFSAWCIDEGVGGIATFSRLKTVGTKESVVGVADIPGSSYVVAIEASLEGTSDAIDLINMSSPTSSDPAIISGHLSLPIAVTSDVHGRWFATLHATGEVILWPVEVIHEVRTAVRQPILFHHSTDARLCKIVSLTKNYGEVYHTVTDHAVTRSMKTNAVAAALSSSGERIVYSRWARMFILPHQDDDDLEAEQRYWEDFKRFTPQAMFVESFDGQDEVVCAGVDWATAVDMSPARVELNPDESWAVGLFIAKYGKSMLVRFPTKEESVQFPTEEEAVEFSTTEEKRPFLTGVFSLVRSLLRRVNRKMPDSRGASVALEEVTAMSSKERRKSPSFGRRRQIIPFCSELPNGVNRFAFSPDGQVIVLCNSERGEAAIVNPYVDQIATHFVPLPMRSSLRFGPFFAGPDRLVFTSNADEVTVSAIEWDGDGTRKSIKSIEPIQTIKHGQRIFDVFVGKSGGVMAISDSLPSVMVYELPSLNCRTWCPLDQLCKVFLDECESRVLAVGISSEVAGLHFALLEMSSARS